MESPSLVPPPHRAPKLKVLKRAGQALAVAIAIALLVLLWRSAPVQEAWSALTLPDELRAAQLIAYDASGTQIAYGIRTFGYAVEARRYASEVATVLGAEINQSTKKGQWTVSPNRTKVAFTELTIPNYPKRPQSWQVSVADARTGSQQAVGEGSGVLFVDEEHVARLTSAGLVQTNLADGTESALLTHTLAVAPATVSVSPNGSLIAWPEPGEPAIVVYTVTRDGATLVTRYVGPFDSFALADHALFILRYEEGRAHVVRYPLAADAEEVPVHTFPASLRVSSLSFN